MPFKPNKQKNILILLVIEKSFLIMDFRAFKSRVALSAVMPPSAHPACQADSAEKEVAELSEEDVTASYMGDELDLKTVGDIIAIIEDKVQKYLNPKISSR